jgi:aldose 1-epimerase
MAMPSNLDQSALPSGKQFEIAQGQMRAIITEVGAGLRSFSVGGHELLDTYRQDDMAASGRGQVLLPWPNRIDHGKYTFEGKTLQLPLTEPALQNASHGLTRWLNWHAASHEAHRLVMEIVIHAQPGYPFVLALQVSYTLTASGLEVQTTAHNIGAVPLPYGAGYHPYLTVGTETINPAILHVPAHSYFRTDERSIPILPPASVDGTPFDFRAPRPIGETMLDTCFTDLIPDTDGFTRVRLSAPDGQPSVTVFMDASHQFVQIYSGDTLPDTARRRRGLAIEPETCAANAFNNGYGLRVLQPGKSYTSLWGISPEAGG